MCVCHSTSVAFFLNRLHHHPYDLFVHSSSSTNTSFFQLGISTLKFVSLPNQNTNNNINNINNTKQTHNHPTDLTTTCISTHLQPKKTTPKNTTPNKHQQL